MPVRKKYPALGRGLDALIPSEEVHTGLSSSISEIELSRIKPNPDQPRRDFSEEGLQELCESIGEIGIIQPITVRDMGDGTYIIIAGERRWRASRLAGRLTIPAYVRTIDDENMMEMALVENIQREDLNALEVALAYQHLMEQYGLTQERLSQRVGKNRATIANYLRLLRLPAVIQMALKDHTIDMGHARALLALDDPSQQIEVFNQIKDEKASVRRVETLVKEVQERDAKTQQGAKKKTKTATRAFSDLGESLSKMFRVKVQLTCQEGGRGKISIPFNDENELERLMEMFDQIQH